MAQGRGGGDAADIGSSGDARDRGERARGAGSGADEHDGSRKSGTLSTLGDVVQATFARDLIAMQH